MEYIELAEAFQDPAAPYRPMLFWLWNGEITRESIEHQIADFAAKGAGGFFIHPMGENFRLDDFVAGISPPYLSDEYFALVRHAVLCAREHDLYAWLYDEGGWPSGSAQGHVIEGHPEYRGKRLHARRLEVGGSFELPENTVAAVGVPEMGVPQPVDLRELSQALVPFREIIVFTLEPDGYAIDILSAPAVARFIEVTHERYAESVGEFFGSTIPGIFTDETSLGGRVGASAVPWTRGLIELLTTKMGRDARLYLPLLFAPEHLGPDIFNRYSEHEIVAARCEYYDCLTRRFSEAYWQQINRWCAGHGLIHTGHVGGEDTLPGHESFGHFFRTAGVLHAPGVDSIWRQLFPGQDNFPFPRFAASALKHRSRPTEGDWANLVPTETNAVYGFGLNYQQMRWLADYQFQTGVNLYCPMAFYHTTAGGRLYGTMSHTGVGNPLWSHYREFADYIGRISLLLRHTVELARVAVYYPIESVWAGPETVQDAWQSLRQTCLTLTEMQVPFDLIDADFLIEADTATGAAARGDAAYDVIIIPETVAIPSAVLEQLAALAESGATICFLERWPLHAADMQGLEQFDEATRRLQDSNIEPLTGGELDATITDLGLRECCLRLTDLQPDLLVSRRRLGQTLLYFLTNNSPAVLEPYLTIHPERAVGVEIWDLQDGEFVSLAQATPSQPAELRPIIPAWTSLLLVLGPPSGSETLPPEETPSEREFALWLADSSRHEHHPPHVDVLAQFTHADQIRIVEEYLIENGDVRIVSGGERTLPLPPGPVLLQAWEELYLSDFSGRIEYSFQFTLAEQFVERALLLDLGQVFWAARVTLNGEPLADSLWPPHTVDLTGAVRPGANILTVSVSNTLANQAVREDVVTEAQSQGWFNAYYERTLPMMQEDLRGGLIGPVRILVAEVRSS